MYREYWQELTLLLNSSESDISTTLLITPEFHLDNSDGFDEFCNSLMSTMAPLAVEKDIQLVFFHPKYSFRDGAMRTDENGAANYARRSPWPMINILRTNQVRSHALLFADTLCLKGDGREAAASEADSSLSSWYLCV